MVKKSPHPNLQLFDYLNGALGVKAARAIETHLSACDDCASLAKLVSTLKASALEQIGEDAPRTSDPYSEAFGRHPQVGELASFFYAEAPGVENSGAAASHVAHCASCSEAIAQYARAEHAAAEYEPVKEPAGEAVAKAWEMIRDWEDSSFAKLKPASEVLGQDFLDRLRRVLSTSSVREGVGASPPESAERVSVLIVTSSGEIRGVEVFERDIDSTGASVLRHSEGSARFDNRPLHAVFEIGETSFVVSNVIRSGAIRLAQRRPEEQSPRAEYIIIED